MDGILLGFSAVATISPLIARCALREGIVSGSSGIRWSHEPKPLLGGISIVLALFLSFIIGSM